MTELLQEEHGITFSRSTVCRVLLAAGMASPKKLRPPRHRVRRQRMPQEGMLVQVDGSHHAWPEERGPRLVLLLAVDDATGTVPYALFYPEEDTKCYFRLLEGLLRSKGITLTPFSVRHGVFKLVLSQG